MLHISLLEFEFINLTLLKVHKVFPLKAFHFQLDEGIVLSDLMKIAKTFIWETTAMAKKICDFAISQTNIVIIGYLPGKLNVRVDWGSRNFEDSLKWLLLPNISNDH